MSVDAALSCAPGGRLSMSPLEVGMKCPTGGAGPAMKWLHEFGRAFLNRLCQVRNLDAMTGLDEDACRSWISRMPPMRGAEYVTEEVVQRWWKEMLHEVVQRASEGLEAWLLSLGEEWQGVGRVTFHLAENKNDAVRPFAFLATFAERLSVGGRLQHLPLARALQKYAGGTHEGVMSALLNPLRKAATCSAWMQRMLETRRVFQALAWQPSEAYEMVCELQTLRECGLVVKVPDWWSGGRPSRPVVQVVLETEKLSSTGVAAMLNFKIQVALDGEPLTQEELEKIRSAKSGLVTLRGRWVEMNVERLDEVLAHWQRVQRLHEEAGLSFYQGMRFLAGFDAGRPDERTVRADSEARETWSQVTAGQRLADTLRALREPETVPPPEGLAAVLRPYQQQGFAWLWFMQKMGLGACLADDMGLGKTIQVIALLLKLKQSGAANPSLIVCPASLLGNWRAELRKFAPSLVFKVQHSSAGAEDQPVCPDVVLTTYFMATRELRVHETAWEVIVLDEAQAIKNPAAQQTLAVKRLRSRARIALTGTPVENRPGDLWSLFDFLNPGLLGSAVSFAEKLKELSTSRGVDYGPLRRLIRPYLLRRMKTDKRIISDLPEKIEVRVNCGLTRRQAVIYARLVEELKRTLGDRTVEGVQRRGQVLGFLSKFKQVCNHPSHYSGDGQYHAEDSGKFLRLAELATELAERQERVVVFTQYQEMCAPLVAHLERVFGLPGLMLHGGTPVAKRAELVKDFQREDGPPFFVVSVKAGGTGLTLTAATHVIHFDRWWNPAVENQATDRAYRIGQTRNVIVHKFVVSGTLEERVDRLLEEKRALSDSLLADETEALRLTELSDEELLSLVSLDMDGMMQNEREF